MPAVAALGITKPYDFHLRILAVQNFKQLPEAEALSVAYKRINNILQKDYQSKKDINMQLFENSAEVTLAKRIQEMNPALMHAYAEAHYVQVLTQLASLRKPVDDFFDQVMVMTEDEALRENRLLLLSKLRAAFFQVADIALLQTR